MNQVRARKVGIGRSNLSNQRIIFYPASNPKGKSFTLFKPDGTIRKYINLENQEKVELFKKDQYLDYRYKLVSETLPNGHIIRYDWDHENRLTRIYTTSPKGNRTFSSVNIPVQHPKHPRSEFTLKGSDERFVHYKKSYQGKFLLHKTLSSSDHPDYSFQWQIKENCPLLSHFSLPLGRSLQIEYDDTSEHRVKTLLAPFGKNGKVVPIHTFSYHPQERYTEVFDVHQNKTTYHWDEEFRLTKIDRIQNSEQFIWDGTLLRCKTFFDSQRNPLFSRLFTYDSLGNILQETFYGNLSGKSSPLSLNEKGFPVEDRVEKWVKTTTYTQDGKNLPLTQTENEITTTYTYLPGTNLVQTKKLLRPSSYLCV